MTHVDSVTINFSCLINREYRKIPIISRGLIFVQKAVLLAYFRARLFSEGLLIRRNFAFQNGLGLTIKQLALTVHGLIFGRAYYRKDFCVWDLGGLFSGGLIFFFWGGGLLSECYGILPNFFFFSFNFFATTCCIFTKNDHNLHQHALSQLERRRPLTQSLRHFTTQCLITWQSIDKYLLLRDRYLIYSFEFCSCQRTSNKEWCNRE